MSWNWEIFIVRAIFVIGLVAASNHLRPFQLNSLMSSAMGTVLGVLVVILEARLDHDDSVRLVLPQLQIGLFGEAMLRAQILSRAQIAGNVSFKAAEQLLGFHYD